MWLRGKRFVTLLCEEVIVNNNIASNNTIVHNNNNIKTDITSNNIIYHCFYYYHYNYYYYNKSNNNNDYHSCSYHLRRVKCGGEPSGESGDYEDSGRGGGQAGGVALDSAAWQDRPLRR